MYLTYASIRIIKGLGLGFCNYVLKITDEFRHDFYALDPVKFRLEGHQVCDLRLYPVGMKLLTDSPQQKYTWGYQKLRGLFL